MTNYVIEANLDSMKTPKRVWSLTIHNVDEHKTTILKDYNKMKIFFHTTLDRKNDYLWGDIRFSYVWVEKVLKDNNLMPEPFRDCLLKRLRGK